MPNQTSAPKHRGAPSAPTRADRTAQRVKGGKRKAARRAAPIGAGVRNAAMLSGVAVAATGVVVTAGVAIGSGTGNNAAVALGAHAPVNSLTAAELTDRVKRASRSSNDRLAGVDATKAAVLSDANGVAQAGVKDLSNADPRTLAQALLPQFGLSSGEFDCLDRLWTKESNWNPHADNPSSSAYGIPQALPGSKMSSAGPDWANNPETQIRWGLGYIKSRYGTPCAAWGHSVSRNWY